MLSIVKCGACGAVITQAVTNCNYCGAALVNLEDKNPVQNIGIDPKILELLKTGKFLEAVKTYKEQSGLGLKESKEYVDKLAKANGIKQGGCFVATACYGNYNSPEVLVLRKYRDEYLLNSPGGKFLVWIYYSISPPLARYIRRSERIRNFVRSYFLGPIVELIRKKQT